MTSARMASRFLHGVEQRLALGDARRRGAHVDDVGAEPLAGELERGARARRRLEEEVDDRLAAQGRSLLRLGCRRQGERCLSRVEDVPMSSAVSSSIPVRWRWVHTGWLMTLN